MLNTEEIAAIGNEISEILSNHKLRGCELNITVKSDLFTKIDEDLFYRLNKDDEKPFVPSVSEIHVNFANVTLNIKKE